MYLNLPVPPVVPQDKVDAMVAHLASLSDRRLIVSFAPNTLAYSILKRIGELFPGPSKVGAAACLYYAWWFISGECVCVVVGGWGGGRGGGGRAGEGGSARGGVEQRA
jgi:hypothetical protein